MGGFDSRLAMVNKCPPIFSTGRPIPWLFPRFSHCMQGGFFFVPDLVYNRTMVNGMFCHVALGTFCFTSNVR